MKKELVEAGFAIISELRGSIFAHYHGYAVIIDAHKNGLVRVFFEPEIKELIGPETFEDLNLEYFSAGITLCFARFIADKPLFDTVLEICDRIIPYTKEGGFTFLPNMSFLSAGEDIQDFINNFDCQYYYTTLKSPLSHL